EDDGYATATAPSRRNDQMRRTVPDGAADASKERCATPICSRTAAPVAHFGGLRSHPVLLRRAQWRDRFGDPVPAQEFAESVPPSRIRPALRTDGCGRGNCGLSRFRYRGRIEASLWGPSTSAQALEQPPASAPD